MNLIRKYLKAGVMEKGLEKAITSGVPQGGPLSVVLSNLGFTLNNSGEWKVKPTTEKKKKLKQKLSEYLKRNKAIARPLAETIKRVK